MNDAELQRHVEEKFPWLLRLEALAAALSAPDPREPKPRPVLRLIQGGGDDDA